MDDEGPMREPAVAGMFYPAGQNKLRSELDRCFSKVDPSLLPAGSPRITGLVSPHAGYAYSGWIAAHGFTALRIGGLPRTAVVIGPNHSGLGDRISVSFEDWRTPLGVMKCDKALAQSLGLPNDELAHLQEHSMEVQLPFLQSMDPKMEQVCIAMLDQRMDTAIELGEGVAMAVKASGHDCAVVASSDFTHAGYNYGKPVPRGMNAGEFARSIDLPVIAELERGDIEAAFEKRDELDVTACGLGPIAAMMTACSIMGAKKVKAVRYATSYDISPSASAVGYASLTVY
jgi:AmmeMemoRadiSam system protein B